MRGGSARHGSEACCWPCWPGFAVCHVDRKYCGVFPKQRVVACGLEVTKVQMVARREEWVQALGWPKARLAGAAIYSWGRWSVTAQSLRAASSSCLKGTCLRGEGNLSQLCWVQIWTPPLIERPHLSAKAGAQAGAHWCTSSSHAPPASWRKASTSATHFSKMLFGSVYCWSCQIKTQKKEGEKSQLQPMASCSEGYFNQLLSLSAHIALESKACWGGVKAGLAWQE